MLILQQVEERVGNRGSVHDTYNLIADGTIVATIRQYIEYFTPEEVPVTFEPAWSNGVDLFQTEPETDEEIDKRFETEDEQVTCVACGEKVNKWDTRESAERHLPIYPTCPDPD